MSEAWDTTLVSRAQPSGSLHLEVVRRAREGDPVAVASVSLAEIAYGLRQAVEEGNPGLRGPLAWFAAIPEAGIVDVLPLSGTAAAVAGEVRALHPSPPTTGRRRRQSKSERRVAWNMDIMIAATAWAEGRAVRAGNRSDFETIRRLISKVAPDGPELAILSP